MEKMRNSSPQMTKHGSEERCFFVFASFQEVETNKQNRRRPKSRIEFIPATVQSEKKDQCMIFYQILWDSILENQMQNPDLKKTLKTLSLKKSRPVMMPKPNSFVVVLASI